MVKKGIGTAVAHVKSALAAAGMLLMFGASAAPAYAQSAPAIMDPQAFSRATRARASNNAYNMAGATYAIYSDQGCSQDTGKRLIVQDNNGTTNEVELVAGTYWVKEIAPDLNRGFTGYNVSNQVHRLDVTAGQLATVSDATEPMMYDSMALDLVHKGILETSTTGVTEGDIPNLSGVEFKVDFYTYLYKSIAEAEGSGAPDASVTVRTDAQGKVTGAAFSDGSAIVSGTWPYKIAGRNVIPLGTVVMTETKASEGLKLDATKRGWRVMDANLDEASMRNTGVSNSPTNTKRVQLSSWRGGTTGPSTHADTVNRGALTVIKVDADRDVMSHLGSATNPSTPQGDATLEGVVYRVSNESKTTVWIHKDTEGLLKKSGATADGYIPFAKGEDILELKSKQLDDGRYGIKTADHVFPYGTYKVREVKASTGYQENTGWWRSWTIRTDGYRQVYDRSMHVADGQVDNVNSWNCNEVIRGGVRITKHDTDLHESYGQGDATMSGAKYTIKNKSKKSVVVNGREVAPDVDVMEISTGDDGWATTGEHVLPYGTYEIRETGAPEGYHLNKTWKQQFTIRDANMVSIDPGAEDPVVRGGLRVRKVDADLGEAYGQGDAADDMKNTTFAIKNMSKRDVWVKGVRRAHGEDVMTITSGKDGVAATGEHDLPYGTYEVRETAAPVGYRVNDAWRVTVQIRRDGVIVDAGEVLSDPVIHGGVEVFKVDGETGNGTASGNSTFEGTEITIKNVSAHDIVYEGKRVKPQEDVTKIYADKTGRAATPADVLPYGTYELRETRAPQGYEINPDWRAEVEIRTQGVIVAANTKLGDDATQYVCRILKRDSDGVNTGQGDASLSACRFKVINDSKGPVTVNGKTYQPGDVITDKLTTGTYDPVLDCYPIQFDLPCGKYKIIEYDPGFGNEENLTIYTMIVPEGAEF